MASAEGRPPVVGVPPPKAFLTVFNVLVRMLARTPVSRVLGTIGVLRFTGRRSGRQFEVPAGIHDLGSGTYGVFSDSVWRLNFRGGRPIQVMLRGRRHSARAELVEDPAEIGPAFLIALEKGGGNPRQHGLSVAPGHHVTAEDLANVGRALIRIRFDD